jgi:hypothetical protein
MLVADKMLLQTFHAPFPALGHMEKEPKLSLRPGSVEPSCLTCVGTLTCFMHPGAQRPWQLIRPDYPQSQVSIMPHRCLRISFGNAVLFYRPLAARSTA